MVPAVDSLSWKLESKDFPQWWSVSARDKQSVLDTLDSQKDNLDISATILQSRFIPCTIEIIMSDDLKEAIVEPFESILGTSFKRTGTIAHPSSAHDLVEWRNRLRMAHRFQDFKLEIDKVLAAIYFGPQKEFPVTLTIYDRNCTMSPKDRHDLLQHKDVVSVLFSCYQTLSSIKTLLMSRLRPEAAVIKAKSIPAPEQALGVVNMAANTVFAIPELLENILLCLSARDILLIQHTARSFNETINSSIQIQRHLFFAPIASQDETEDKPAGFNPLVLHILEEDDPEEADFAAHIRRPILNMPSTASCHRMLLVQPVEPIYVEWYTVRHDACFERFRSGITVGELLSVLRQEFWRADGGYVWLGMSSL
ncbi:hypothetical protein LTR86_002270 [Recurvomyces mirabilis]|nr:hypothetical protein LTR86_002270 [Recurvomyces mirabilis]